MNISCDTCKRRLPIVRYDYATGECNKMEVGGYICLRFADAGYPNSPHASWVTGIDDKEGFCREYAYKGDTVSG